VHRSDATTTICEGLRSELIGRGIPAAKIDVIPNAVDIADFQVRAGRDDSLARKLGLEGCTVLGFVGSFYAYEGLNLLLDAVPALRRARPELRVLLVGGGPQELTLRQKAATLGLEQVVMFCGRVPHQDVASYYELIDILCYPRLKMRLTDLVTPLKPLEAMAQGRLLVASDVGGHRELIQDGRTGILFPAGDAAALASKVLALLESPHLWAGLRQRGRGFVEDERSWSASVARYQRVYDGVLRS
jgi:PEP-CTERM/exosortase A-associated glycosyltransferase